MSETIHGVIHGKTIELAKNPGIADGRKVDVTVRPVENQRPWGEGIRRSAGALAESWTEEDDKILREIYLDRKRSSREMSASSRNDSQRVGFSS